LLDLIVIGESHRLEESFWWGNVKQPTEGREFTWAGIDAATLHGRYPRLMGANAPSEF
jgi:hypothetical protein